MIKICQKCNEEVDDIRILYMSCGYDMDELKIPFEKETIIEGGIHDSHPNTSHKFYTLFVCKDCRASWMEFINIWFIDKKIKSRLDMLSNW